MIRVLFKNQEEPVNAEVKKISDHVIQIKGNISLNLSGFILMNDYGSVFGKYEGFNTLYREVEGGFQLSDNGSSYIEPEEPDIPITPEETIEDVKLRKKSEIKNRLNSRIYSGVEFEGNNFTYNIEETSNIRHKYEDSVYTGKDVILSSSDGRLIVFSPEKMKILYTNLEKNKIANESRKESLIQMINDLQKKEEVDKISADTELSGEYLELYNKKVSQQEDILNETKLFVEFNSIQNNMALYDLTDDQAIFVKDLYKNWEDDEDGYEYDINNPEDLRKNYGEYLWRLNKNHRKQKNWFPGSEPALWVLIQEKHKGTLEDPIPVPDIIGISGFEYEYGKYYAQDNVIYLAKREGKQDGEKEILYFKPSDLLNQYFIIA